MIELRGMAALMVLGMAVALPAAAQERGGGDWPSRAIHFIVPFPAGGSTD